jgi:hypothetical protein
MKIVNKIILSLLLVSSFVWANSIGSITALKGSASIVRDGVTIEAMLGAKLNEKDSITTQDKSKVQLIFNDETIITIGKNSHFSINEYLFENNKTPQAKFSLISGAMRTITGKIGKIAPEKFKVETKTATIGIRGTNFTVLVGADGSTQVFCTFGAITASTKGETLTVPQGFYTSVSTNGKIGKAVKFTPSELDKMKADSFTANKDDKVDSEVNNGTETLSETSANTETTTSQTSGLAITDITADNAQKKRTDKIVAKVSKTFDISGYSTLSDVLMRLKTLNLSTFDSKISFITTDDWEFELARAMNGAGTINDFSGTFKSATSRHEYTDNSISNSAFTATNDDYSRSDVMTWGTWNVTVAYDFENMPKIDNLSGLWVAGNPTDTTVIDGYTTGAMVATYKGVYRALTPATGQTIGDIVNGKAQLEVDFGQQTAALSITSETFASTSIPTTISGKIDSTTKNISGSGDNSSFNGTFYGTDGKSVGGNFNIAAVAEGVYQVSTTDIH